VADQTLQTFFAWAPWVIFATIVLVTYFMTRASSSSTHASQTFACAQCGKRGTQEQMVPVEHEGAVTWYCAHCAAVEKT
jgi:hypothetical protein